MFHTSGTPAPTIFGFDDSLAATVSVEKIFDNSGTTKPYFVKEGEWIGDFAYQYDDGGSNIPVKIGFEVIMNADRYNIDLSFVRAANTEIDVSSFSGFDLRAKREQILSFIDPAAFFGIHHDKGVKFSTYTGSTKNTKTTKTDQTDADYIYTVLLNKFANKNRVYIDIRSERGYSYNFYQNYKDTTDGDKNIKFGNSVTSPVSQVYQTSGWPVLYTESAIATSSSKNDVKLVLRIDDNLKPLLFCEDKKLLGGSDKYFLKENKILNGLAVDWSKELTFKYPNTGSGGSKDNIAYYIKLYYFRKEYNAASPNTVLKNEKYFDSAFCAIDNLPTIGAAGNLWQNLESTNFIYIRGVLNSTEFGYSARNGSFWDNSNIIFYARSIFQHANTSDFYSSQGIESRLAMDGDAFNKSFINKNVNINIGLYSEEIAPGQFSSLKIVSIDNYFDAGFPRSKESLLLICLTRQELDSLKAVSGFSSGHDRYLFLEEDVPSPKTDENGLSYYRFKVKVQGLDNNGNKVIASVPGNEIYVYSN